MMPEGDFRHSHFQQTSSSHILIRMDVHDMHIMDQTELGQKIRKSLTRHFAFREAIVSGETFDAFCLPLTVSDIFIECNNLQ